MTASHALDARPTAGRTSLARARGIDLIVMRMSLAALRWARRRADRAAAARDTIAAVRATAEATARREHDYAVRAHRLPY